MWHPCKITKEVEVMKLKTGNIEKLIENTGTQWYIIITMISSSQFNHHHIQRVWLRSTLSSTQEVSAWTLTASSSILENAFLSRPVQPIALHRTMFDTMHFTMYFNVLQKICSKYTTQRGAMRMQNCNKVIIFMYNIHNTHAVVKLIDA